MSHRPIDHLIVGAADLTAGVDWVAERLGVVPMFGGRHPRWGTANYLVSLGPATYLEILAPDPEAEPTARRGAGRPLFGIERLDEPRLVTWAAAGTDLESWVADARERGVELGDVHAGSRTRPDGTELSWTFTDPAAFPADGVVPFFIDWGDTPHPSVDSPDGGRLMDLRAEHPEPEPIRIMLAALALDLALDRGASPALVATVRTTAGGEIELR